MKKSINEPCEQGMPIRYFNRKYASVIKHIDRWLAFFYSLAPRRAREYKSQKKYGKILILESHLIGDVIMGLPAYRALRSNFPESRLIYWGNGWGEDLLSEQGLFDRFFVASIPWATYDYSLRNIFRLLSQVRKLRKMKIDIAVDFRGDIRNIFLLYLVRAKRRVSYAFTGGTFWLTDVVPPPENYHVIDRDLKIVQYLEAKIEYTVPTLEVFTSKIEIARKYFEQMGCRRVVILHPGASQKKRFWPAERFARVVDYLSEREYSPVLLCGPKEKTLLRRIQERCKSQPNILSVPLKDLPAFLSCCSFFIGIDSGISHIAAAVGKNIITLFGPQLPSLTSARGRQRNILIIKTGFRCRPCFSAECDYDNACMKAIQVEDVISAIKKMEAALNEFGADYS